MSDVRGCESHDLSLPFTAAFYNILCDMYVYECEYGVSAHDPIKALSNVRKYMCSLILRAILHLHLRYG